ncbi:MAG: ubiquinol-cytochrome c reductase iron-sulfur subunit [Bacteroidetes bacterium]|nr:ubiquinol-cytochrome c reductase iron-sulfur subunit [Bacteroidota bacterium]
MNDNKKESIISQITEKKISRKKLISMIGLGAFSASIFTSLFAAVRFLTPKVLYEPSAKFSAETPDTYKVGSVEFVSEKKTYLVNDGKGIYAQSAICTHLGCTVNWQAGEKEYHCPCHGSKFDKDGKNIAGPAPRPLDRYHLIKGKDGRIVVDTGKIVDENARLT